MDDPKVQRLRDLNRIPNATYETFRKGIESPDPAISANAIIGPHSGNKLFIGPAIKAVFLKEGGLRERVTRARLEARKKEKLP